MQNKIIVYFVMILIFASCNFESKQQVVSQNQDARENPEFVNPSATNEGKVNNAYMCCYNSGLTAQNISTHTPNIQIKKQVENIVTYSGLPSNFEIFEAPIENAAALIINSRRIILYDYRLLNAIDKATKSYWSSISIISHEIGHHLSGHTLSNGGNLQQELEADEFSGFILYKMGASLEMALNAIEMLGSDFDSKTHPCKVKRINAITKGWNNAAKQRFNSAIPPPPDDLPTGSCQEYTINMLWDENLLTNDYPNQYSGVDKMLYGIITDVEVKPSHEGSKFEVYFIDTKQKAWIDFYAPLDGKEMSNWARSWFYEILKPGRRIKFSYIIQGSGGFTTLTYLKPLNGNSF